LEIDLSLLAIADLAVIPRQKLAGQVLAAARGGATAVQLRGKELTSAELLDAADELVPVLTGQGVPLLVNDRADVAALASAAGVHLGEEDLEVGMARELLGPRAIIGRTARTPDAVLRAAADGADYVGVGSVYPGGTKAGVPVLGLPGLRALIAASPVPVVAIGGIDADRARECVALGAAGVAVIGALFTGVHDAAEVEARARQLKASVESGRAEQSR
jgi:thiamine-phosphate diphosphorylase